MNTIGKLTVVFGMHAALPCCATGPENEAPPTELEMTMSDDLEMIRVSAGEFVVGDTTGVGRADEGPVRRLRIERPFLIARYEITNARYARFVAATAHAPPSHWTDGVCPEDLLDHAVTHVSWVDAQAYCAWVGARLPSEAEWEYAARGTTRWAYPWGDEFQPEMANTRHEANVLQEPVGSHPAGASPFGVEDMAGGVWEWVQDAYVESRWGELEDGAIPGVVEQGTGRVLKGGAWTLAPELARISARDRTNETARGLQIGFRIVRDVTVRDDTDA